MAVYSHNDNEFGRMRVCTRSGMRSVTVCVKLGTVELHVPLGIQYADLLRIVDENRDNIRQLLTNAASCELHYHLGQVIECLGGWKIIIGEQQTDPGTIIYGYARPGELAVNVPRGLDFSQSTNTKWISNCLKKLAAKAAHIDVLMMADEVAQELGVHPTEFVIGRGLRKLGHCTRQGVIQLSSNLMFLPLHLARFVVMHELAHLSHFDHSPQFHALLDKYCQGKERQLDQELKYHQWPILRQ